MECKELNAQHRKNQTFDEIKSHHYILSFDPKDVEESGLTGERAQQLGLEYARKNFPGHQALVCTHTDGNNKSGNIHVHIVINSLRKHDVERQDFMERPCDSRAGYKHHLTKDYLSYLKKDVMDLCQREQLHQVDLLSPAEKKITDREYHARRRGQKKLERLNQHSPRPGIVNQGNHFRSPVHPPPHLLIPHFQLRTGRSVRALCMDQKCISERIAVEPGSSIQIPHPVPW